MRMTVTYPQLNRSMALTPARAQDAVRDLFDRLFDGGLFSGRDRDALP